MAQTTPSLEHAGIIDDSRAFVLITGASEGIGLAFAELYAARGRNVLMVARTATALEAVRDRLRASSRGDIQALALDLNATDALERLDAELQRISGHVDLLVNNAGMGLSGPFMDMAWPEVERLVRLNVTVPLMLMRHLLTGMRQRGAGGVINVASLAGVVPGPYQAAYYASKAALVSASRAIGAEVRASGICLTVVASGPVETRFHTKMAAEGALYRRLIPAASPARIARMAVFGYELGLQLVLPNFISTIGFICCRVVPDAILVPIVAWLLKPPERSETGVQKNV